MSEFTVGKQITLSRKAWDGATDAQRSEWIAILGEEVVRAIVTSEPIQHTGAWTITAIEQNAGTITVSRKKPR